MAALSLAAVWSVVVLSVIGVIFGAIILNCFPRKIRGLLLLLLLPLLLLPLFLPLFVVAIGTPGPVSSPISSSSPSSFESIAFLFFCNSSSFFFCRAAEASSLASTSSAILSTIDEVSI